MDPGYRWSPGCSPLSSMAPSSEEASPFKSPRGFNFTASPFNGTNPPFLPSPSSPAANPQFLPSPSSPYASQNNFAQQQQPSLYRMNSNPGTKASPEPFSRPETAPSPYDNVSDSPEPVNQICTSVPPASGPPQTEGGPAGPPPPPPPPPPPMPGATPSWREKQEEAKRLSGEDQSSQAGALPAALQSTLSKDKKPFTYTPGGLDLSQIRSPRIQRRIQANRNPESPENEPATPSGAVQRQMTRPEQPACPKINGYDQVARQIEGLNLAESRNKSPSAPTPELATASLPRHFLTRQASAEQSPKNFVQSKSFKILQKVVGTDNDQETPDDTAPVQSPRVEPDEMRFTGLRRGGDHVPSRSFQVLQRMTEPENSMPYTTLQQQEQYPLSPPPQYLQERELWLQQQRNQQPYVSPNQSQPQFSNQKPQQYGQTNQYAPQQNHYRQPQASYDYGQGHQDQSGVEEGLPVDIRYTGSNIPSRSFKILQEMTGEGSTAGPAPSVWSPQQQQAPARKISRIQMQQQRDHAPSPPPPKLFPRPEVPASQQALEAEPRKYSGARIPSQSFRILQAMTGDTNPYMDDEDGTDF